jgi:hypothetical protein
MKILQEIQYDSLTDLKGSWWSPITTPNNINLGRKKKKKKKGGGGPKQK